MIRERRGNCRGKFVAVGTVATLVFLAIAAWADTPTGHFPPANIVSDSPPSRVEGALPAFPLKPSLNKRYLLDAKGAPFLIIGDAPQSLIANLSIDEAGSYMADRRRYGVNTLWISLLCRFPQVCRDDGSTRDGIRPFMVDGDLSSPNPAYFERADEMIRLAGKSGMVVLLNPIETSAWLDVLEANGLDKAYAYGKWIGERYRNFPNIIWLHGNDFQTWRKPSDNALVQAVARGIKASGDTHLQTVELDYFSSGSLEDPTWAKLVDLDAAYSYFPTFAQVAIEYNRPQPKPVFLIEGNYEFEHNTGTDGGSPSILRRQAYWAMLSGAVGQVYGNGFIWRLERGWAKKLDTPGVQQLQYMRALFADRRWYDLVPDQSHLLVTAGYNGFDQYLGRLATYVGGAPGWLASLFYYVNKFTHIGTMAQNSFVSVAKTSDGSLLLAYLPTSGSVTVDETKLAPSISARWYDPTSGIYVAAKSTALANPSSRRFKTPGKNRAGDDDWVLVLETNPPSGVSAFLQ